MSRALTRSGLAALAALLAACQPGEGPGVSLPEVTLPKLSLPKIGGDDAPYRPPAIDPDALPAPATAAEPALDRSVRIATADAAVPTVYMALEPGRGRPTSVVFAIDASNDQTPGDDPAIRLTPDAGQCNPQELRRYGFEGDAARPVFGRIQAVRGVGPERLPEYMAVAVSRAMIDAGLAASPEETKPQNVCTRKLWEQLVLAESRRASGQP